MAPRIRSVKPEIWQDESLGLCPVGARLLFIGMITQADDEGRLRAAAPLLRAAVFPYDETVSAGKISVWVDTLDQQGMIRVYDVRGQRFADIPNWSKHQRVDKPKPSTLPTFEQRDKHEQNMPLAGDSKTSPGRVADESTTDPGSVPVGGEGMGGEGSGVESVLRTDNPRADTEHPETRIYEAWLGHPNLTQHKKLRPEIRRRITTRLADHNTDELIDAIDLYATCLQSPQHYWTHQWTLSEFMQRGVEKFLAEAQPLTRYKIRDNGHHATNGAVVAPAKPSHGQQVESARTTFASIRAESGEDEARDWLTNVHTPAVCRDVLETSHA